MYQDLLQHARGMGKSSRSENLKQKGNHLALAEYLDKYCSPKTSRPSGKSSSPKTSSRPSGKSTSHEEHDKHEKFVWPWKGIVANIPLQNKDGRYVGESGSKLRDELARKGFNPLKVIPLWNHQGHTGYAVVNFNKDFVGFGNAMSFEKAFASNFHGKLNWYGGQSRGDKLFGWVAREDDYNSRGVIGEHLRKNGDLKSITDIEVEDNRKTKSLVSNLSKTIEAKDTQCKEMKTKLEETSASLNKLMHENKAMTQSYNEEMRRMQRQTLDDTKKIFYDHENFKQNLQSQKEKLERRERELEKREAHYDSERIKLRRLRKMNDSATLEQKKADENVLALVEKHKTEKEDLHKEIIRLQKQIDQRQALELEIEQLRGAAQVMEHMGGDTETRKRMDAIKEELQEKEEELEAEEELAQALIVKERKTNDELQEARKEMINMLKDSKAVRASIGVKAMGVLDQKVFKIAAEEKYSRQEAPKKAEELISLWRAHIEDSDWHPFKVIRVNGADKMVINEEDERLKGLRSEVGDEACQAVITVMSELNEYNRCGRYPVSELWNFKQERRATLKEGAEFILNLWRAHKRKR